METFTKQNLTVFSLKSGGIAKFFIDDSNYILDFNLNNRNILNENTETILILDRSGSMSTEVRRLCSNILPEFVKNLNSHIPNFCSNEKIHFINFDSIAEINYDTPNNIFCKDYNERGCTNFKTALVILDQILLKSTKMNVRVITISDGEMNDQ